MDSMRSNIWKFYNKPPAIRRAPSLALSRRSLADSADADAYLQIWPVHIRRT